MTVIEVAAKEYVGMEGGDKAAVDTSAATGVFLIRLLPSISVILYTEEETPYEKAVLLFSSSLINKLRFIVN